MTKRLEHKIALITGGTTGIGAACARLFRDEGATVIVTGANEDNVAKAVAAGFDAVRCDQTNMDDIDALMAGIADRHGRIDCLMVNAGGGGGAPLADITPEVFDAVIALNLKGVLFTVQRALPLMPDGGAIVLTSSVGGRSAIAPNVAYGAAKAGVRSFGRSFADALIARRIRVNVLTPGLIDTPLFDKMPAPRAMIVDHLKGLVPMGRPGTPDEAATAALFLACSDSSFMTGTEIVVAGGQTDL